ncbi:prepilin peptidase [Streptomyces sp. ISL-66]|uniref:prepilin peptidase n=1 Tax=Streptomyces sp. ISL-66 TaxID=2819186 RepID=UPI001BE935DF|nr:A24 family peptidase [Streptomyces sp. ISL-66]MBT2469519.1 prepilin peptidase [Streptomyces sp. ISL-66]
MTALVAGVVLWGVATGLLVPRVVYRLSVEPDSPWRSLCPADHPLTGPARGWLGRGSCPRCTTAGVRTGRRGTAFAPAGTAVLLITFICLALGAGVGARPELFAWLLLAPPAVLLCLVDRAVYRLPDVLTLPLAAVTAVALGAASLFPDAGGSWPRALLGGLVLGGWYLVLWLINPRQMGFGDVKLALAVGQVLGWYGWPVLIAGTFAAFLAGAVHGLVLMALRRADRTTPLPFGPFMAGGALVGVICAGLAPGAGPGL